MFKSYLHIAARHLTRHRLYALTNVGGLAVGLAGCMLMAIWVLGQLETDRFHEHGERIYRVVTEGEKAARLTTPAVLGTSLQREATEVEAVVRMLNVDNPVPLVSHGEKRFYEDAFLFADPEVLKVFTLPLVAGDAATALAQPFAVLLSESAARKLFGDADPMGQVIRFKDHLDLKVTGILRDLPEQSHLRIEFLASFATVERWLGASAVSDWRRSMYRMYLLLRPGVEKDALSDLLDQLRQEHFGADDRGHWELQALHRIHLHSREDLGISGGGDIREVIILATVACLVLLVACLNYANLGIALAAQRVPLRRGIQPVVMQLWPWHNYLLIRFRTHSLQHVVQQVEAVMAELDPVHPFEYSLLDDRFAAMYRKDERLGTLFASFGGLSLLVACVGMFGLASFAAQRRRMEFGVRKVLGATGVEIGRLLAGELTRLVLMASLLACPIAYFGMAGWMEQFSERAEVGAGPFVAAVAAALVAAWVSVAYHAIRTSRIDPVEALRYE